MGCQLLCACFIFGTCSSGESLSPYFTAHVRRHFGCKSLQAGPFSHLRWGGMPGLKQRLQNNQPGSDPSEAPGAPLRGGIRRRLSSSSTALRQDLESTPLQSSLIRDWARGKLPTPKLQEYCAGARDQGAAGCDRLARLGREGSQPGNMHRDIMSALGQPKGSCDFFWMDIPIEDSERPISHPFVLPHELLATIFRERRDLFNQSILATDEDPT